MNEVIRDLHDPCTSILDGWNKVGLWIENVARNSSFADILASVTTGDWRLCSSLERDLMNADDGVKVDIMA
jgi:hypothetical protein